MDTVAIAVRLIFENAVPDLRDCRRGRQSVGHAGLVRSRGSAIVVYNTRSGERGLPEWSVQKLSGEAKHRLYRATVTAMYVFGDQGERVFVPLKARKLK